MFVHTTDYLPEGHEPMGLLWSVASSGLGARHSDTRAGFPYLGPDAAISSAIEDLKAKATKRGATGIIGLRIELTASTHGGGGGMAGVTNISIDSGYSAVVYGTLVRASEARQ